jgi:hypothetical protein
MVLSDQQDQRWTDDGALRQALAFLPQQRGEFAAYIDYICTLEQQGQLAPEAAYVHIKTFWQSQTP